MSGSLIKINEVIVDTDVASVTLSGIDTTFEVYQVVLSNVVPATNGQSLRARVTKGGYVQTDSNYDEANVGIRADSYAFNDQVAQNASYWNKVGGWSTSSSSGSSGNAILYLFNFQNAEYSFITYECSTIFSGNCIGTQGGAVHTVNTASDGINFYFSSGDIDKGNFSLYGLNK
tara:strand:+ start:26 stop:547 length:522 start_codon:yes stop_codon:yes gene_type:complete